MKRWVPLAFVVVVVLAFALFYVLGAMEQQGASPFGLVNTVGLVAVVIGVLAAGVVLRRASPP